MAPEFCCRGTDEQLADEKIVPGVLVHHAHRQTVGGIGAAEKILHEEFAPAQMLNHAVIERIKFFRLDGRIHRSPGDGIGGHLFPLARRRHQYSETCTDAQRIADAAHAGKRLPEAPVRCA